MENPIHPKNDLTSFPYCYMWTSLCKHNPWNDDDEGENSGMNTSIQYEINGYARLIIYSVLSILTSAEAATRPTAKVDQHKHIPFPCKFPGRSSV